MRTIILLSIFMILGLTAISSSAVENGVEIKLYPQGEPESNGLDSKSFDYKEYMEKNLPGVQAAEAAYYVYLPQGKATGQAVLILPGGGYRRTAMDHEGHMVAKWLNENGIAAVVLRYRMPNGLHHEIPLLDAQRTYALMRENAAKWGFDPNKIGVMGFSAGGHLASSVSTHFTTAEQRPAFSILFYPVITMMDGTLHKGSRDNLLGKALTPELLDRYSNEKRVTAQTPPTILILADDDKSVHPINSIDYYNALHANGVATEMHIYPKGGHGFGFRDSFAYQNEMRATLLRWLNER